MKVYYHRTVEPNVGDDLNAVLWDRLVPDLERIRIADWLVGIGTIVDERLNDLAGTKVVMGSGLRATASGRFGADVRFAAVRGKLSAARLGLGDAAVACDPGFLAAKFWSATRAEGSRIGLIPHIYSTRMTEIARAASDAGIEVISPSLPVDAFFEQLSRCGRVYCESLHGAIFADALGIPWARVRLCSHYYEGPGVSDFKWLDTFSVTGLPVEPLNSVGLLPAKRSWPAMARALRPAQHVAERRVARELVRRADGPEFRVSSRDALAEAVERLSSRIRELSSLSDVSGWPCANPDSAATRARVLMFPKEGKGNAYLRNFSQSVERQGADVEDFNFPRAFLRRYDAVHIHWPETHLRTHSWWRALGKHARLAAMCAWLRARDTKVVWMLHNLESHEKDHWISSRLFRLWFPRACTHVMALTDNGLVAGRRVHPALQTKPSAIVPHGHYRDEYGVPPARDLCRERLGLERDRFVYLFFGSIRRYKNVPELIARFKELEDPKSALVIAGEPVLGMVPEELERLKGSDERIHLHLRFVADQEVVDFLGASDLVVLPYDRVLNSGTVLLALSLNRPILAPRLGALPEIQEIVGKDWLTLYDGPLTSATLAEARSRRVEGEVDLSPFDWDAIGKRAMAVYEAEPVRRASWFPSARMRGVSRGA